MAAFSAGEPQADLHTAAEVALANARRQMEATGKINPVVLARVGDELVSLQITDEMYEAFFASGRGRDVFFRALRRWVEVVQAAAVILITDTYTGDETEKFKALPEEERTRLVNEAWSVEAMAKKGWFTKCEAISVQIQTPNGVTMIEQRYERDRAHRQITWGTRKENTFPIEACSGRSILFGEEKP